LEGLKNNKKGKLPNCQLVILDHISRRGATGRRVCTHKANESSQAWRYPFSVRSVRLAILHVTVLGGRDVHRKMLALC
jgi:hypothetical protein